MLPDDASFYAIIDLSYVKSAAMEIVCGALLEGGCDLLQLRAKEKTTKEITQFAEKIAPLCKAHKTPFIINDYVEIAAEVGADGVHLGQEDGGIGKAREILGPDKIIGRSTHSLEQAIQAEQEGFDYIGFGPLFATPTKPGRPAIGLVQVAEVHEKVRLPIFCIGGIKEKNLSDVLEAGARRVVIVSELLQAIDPKLYLKKIHRQLRKN